MSNGYPIKTDPSISDHAIVWDNDNSCYRRVALSAINTLFDTTNESASPYLNEPVSQYSAPATGATVSITDADDDTHLILTPSGALTTLTIELPATVRDKKTVLVNCAQIVNTLTVDSNGAASVNGAPTSLTANGYFKMKYDIVVDAWYRVG